MSLSTHLERQEKSKAPESAASQAAQEREPHRWQGLSACDLAVSGWLPLA